jgi:hypothetical protein
VFQGGEGLRSPKSAGQAQKPIQSTEVEAITGPRRRANTTLASSTFLSSTDEDAGRKHESRPKGDFFLAGPLKQSPSKKKDVGAGLPARPATSFDSFTPHQPLKAPSFFKQSPEKRDTQRRQSSLDANSTTQHRLSEARARLKSIGEEKTGRPADALGAMNLSPRRRETGIHELQNLIDDAIDEQAKLEVAAASTKQSPRLQPIASQVELKVTSPTKRQSVEAESSGSPLRRGRSVRNASRPRKAGSGSMDASAKGRDSTLLSSKQQTSPTRKQRLSTESVFPRSSIDSEQPTTLPYCSIYSSPEVKAGPEILQLHLPLPGSMGRSPVKQRAAAFEKMMQHDKQIMYKQPHRHNGKIHVKKHWWPELSDNDEARYIQAKVKPEPTSATTKTGQTVHHNSPASTRSVAPPLRSGPIPLALPQLISSRGRAVSAVSQFEDGFETAPESEAALSRLSSRMHSPRTIPKLSGAHDVGNETRSPLFRWKPFMLDRTSPANKVFPASPPRESTLDTNAGSDVPGHALDADARQNQVRARDPLQAANNERALKQEHEPKKPMLAARAKEVMGVAAPRRSGQESQILDQPMQLSPKRLLLRSPSANQDHMSTDGATNGTTPKQADSAERRPKLALAEQSCSSSDITVDDGKEVALPQTDSGTDECGGTATGTGPETRSSRHQSKDTTPFPLMPAEASSATSGASSPIRGRAVARTLQRQSTVMREEGNGDSVRVSRSQSKAGNVRVTVEVRTPQGSPAKGNGGKEECGERDGTANRMADRVVIVTTDVQQGEEGG